MSIYKNKEVREISQKSCLKLLQRSSLTTKADSSTQECKKITDLVSWLKKQQCALLIFSFLVKLYIWK